ncbi:MAG: hypothetical protein Q4D97_01335 [Eubacteriales bacterium]|nr:hypothetical protein [Eubacteriales bacterium]
MSTQDPPAKDSQAKLGQEQTKSADPARDQEQAKSADQARLESYPLPPLPGQEGRKPLLEKSERRFGEVFWSRLQSYSWRLPSKWLLFSLGGLLLLVFLALIYFRWTASPEEAREVAWQRLEVPHLQKSSYELLSGQDGLLDRLNKAFSLEETGQDRLFPLANRSLLQHAEPDNPASPWLFQASPESSFTLSDHLLQLKVLLAQRRQGPFLTAVKGLNQLFPEELGPEAPAASWPGKLAYLRVLFLASQYWQEDFFQQEISRLSQELLPIFEEDNRLTWQEDFEEIIPTVISSNEAEDYQGDLVLKVVPLAQIDLWVLQALASQDAAWQDIADHWQAIAQGARLDSGFYAYAWNPETESYVPSAISTFQSDSLASLRQISYLWEIGQGRTDDLLTFNQLIMASGQLYTSYNQINLSPTGDQISLPALLAYKKVSLLAGQNLSLDLARQGLKLLTRGDSLPPGQGFLFRPGQEDVYYFQDNYLNLLLTAWELSLDAPPAR